MAARWASRWWWASTANQGAGIYRGAPFEVFVARTPTGLEVTGIFAATVSDFELSTARINGQIGICAYDLRWNGKVYAGYRGCGEKVEPISVSLPATLAKWSDVEVVGALGFLMNLGGPIRMDPLADNSARYRNAPAPDPALAPYYEMAADARTGLQSLPGDKPHDWRREFLSSGATWECPPDACWPALTPGRCFRSPRRGLNPRRWGISRPPRPKSARAASGCRAPSSSCRSARAPGRAAGPPRWRCPG